MVCPLNIRVVRGGEVLRPMGREFLGWRDWVGRVGGGGSSGWVGVGENPIPKVHEFPPQWPGTSTPLTSLTMSGQTIRLKKITL